MRTFIESIELDPDEKDMGRIIKHIDLTFPVYFDGQEGDRIRMPKENTVETVCLLSNRKPKPDTHVDLTLDMEDYYRIKDQEKQSNK